MVLLKVTDALDFGVDGLSAVPRRPATSTTYGLNRNTLLASLAMYLLRETSTGPILPEFC